MLKSQTNLKRLLSLLLALTMVLSMFPMSALQVNAEEATDETSETVVETTTEPETDQTADSNTIVTEAPDALSETEDTVELPTLVLPERIVELPEVSISGPSASFFSPLAPTLKEGNFAKWIDRIDLTDHPDMAAFYTWMTENDDGSGALLTATEAGSNIHTISIQSGSFTYTADDDVQQMVYDAFDDGAEWFDMKSLFASEVFAAYDRDHPEVFWLTGGASVKHHMEVTEITATSVSYNLLVSVVLQDAAEGVDIRNSDYRSTEVIQAAIDNRNLNRNAVLAEIDGQTRYEKIKQLNAWLTNNNGYNTSANLNSIPNDCRECISALDGRIGTEGPVCEGYARAFKVLCDALGIPCVLVDGDNHMWNYVQMEDGNWYAVDVTWNDPLVTGVSGAVSGYESEEYLLIGENRISVDHTVENTALVNGLAFLNGPVLSATDYVPVNTEGGDPTPEPPEEPDVPGDEETTDPYLAYRVLKTEPMENSPFSYISEDTTQPLVRLDDGATLPQNGMMAIFYLVTEEAEIPVYVHSSEIGMPWIDMPMALGGIPVEGEPNQDYFYAVYYMRRGNAAITGSDGTNTVTVNVTIPLPELGVYTSEEMNVDTYLLEDFMLDPFGEDQVFYVGYAGTEELLSIELLVEEDDYSSVFTVQPTENPNVYQVVVNADAARNFAAETERIYASFEATTASGTVKTTKCCEFVEADLLVMRDLDGMAPDYSIVENYYYSRNYSFERSGKRPVIFYMKSTGENGEEVYTPVHVTTKNTDVLRITPVTGASVENGEYYYYLEAVGLGNATIEVEGAANYLPMTIEVSLGNYSFHTEQDASLENRLDDYRFQIDPFGDNYTFYLRVNDDATTAVLQEDSIQYAEIEALENSMYSITLTAEAVDVLSSGGGIYLCFDIQGTHFYESAGVFCIYKNVPEIYMRGLSMDENGFLYEQEDDYISGQPGINPNHWEMCVFYLGYPDENGDMQYTPVHPACDNEGVSIISVSDEAAEGAANAAYFYRVDYSGAGWNDVVKIYGKDVEENHLPFEVSFVTPDVGFFSKPEFDEKYNISRFNADPTTPSENVFYFYFGREGAALQDISIWGDNAVLEPYGDDGKWYQITLDAQTVVSAMREGQDLSCGVDIVYTDADGNVSSESHHLNITVSPVSYLSVKQLYDYGYGIFEDSGNSYESTATMTKWDTVNVIFYWNYQDAEGNWQCMPVHPDKYDSDAISLTKITKNVAEDAVNAEYYYQLSINKAQWDHSYTIGYTDAEQILYVVNVKRNDVGFYTAPEFTNENSIGSLTLDTATGETVVYFGFERENVTISDVRSSNDDYRINLETVTDGVWYKLTINNDCMLDATKIETGYYADVSFMVTDEYGNSWYETRGIPIYSSLKEYLSYCWLEEDAYGIYLPEFYYENTDQSMWGAPGDEMHIIFFRNYLENGEWKSEPVHVTSENAVKLSRMVENEDYTIREGETLQEYFYILKPQAAGWDSEVFVNHNPETCLGVKIHIQRNDIAFYSAPAFTNQNYLINPIADLNADEYVFYLGNEREGATLSEVICTNGDDRIVLETVTDGQWYKITLNNDCLMEAVKNRDGFYVNLGFQVTDSEGNTRYEYRGVHIKSEMSEYLTYCWLDEYGDGWHLEEYRLNDWEQSLQGAPGEKMHLIFFRNYWENGEKKSEPVHVTSENAEKAKLTRMIENEDYTIREDEALGEYFYILEPQAAGWDTVVFMDSDSETCLGVKLNICRKEVGFYSSETLSNDTWLVSYTMDATLDENVLYLAVDAENAVITRLDENWLVQEYEKIQDNLYKVILKPQVVHDAVRNNSQHNLNIYLEYRIGEDEPNGWGLDLPCVPKQGDPYLSVAHLDNWGSGWFQYIEATDINMHMLPIDERYVIFYLNTMEEDGTWTQTPVHPTSANDYLVLTPLAEVDGSKVAPDAQNSEYYYLVTATEDAWDRTSKITYNSATIPVLVDLYVSPISLFKDAEISYDNVINEFAVNPLAPQYTMYLGYSGEDDRKLTDVKVVDEYIAQYVTVERLDNGMYALKLTDAAVKTLMEGWSNYSNNEFGISLECTITETTQNDDGTPNVIEWTESWSTNCRIEMPESVAHLRINGNSYYFYRDHEGVAEKHIDDEYGSSRSVVKLAEEFSGVSYDPETNTLTLNNAKLTQLEAGYHWIDQNWETGEIYGEGYELPSDTLTVNLIGENSITGTERHALCLIQELKMVITSDCGGSLHLKAENSNENSEWLAAVQMRDKSSLTVAGNAQVTAEISGSYSWYDGVYTYYDHLTAIFGDDTLNAIAVTQNATLTTQIPEGAVSGGADLQENGFSGIDNIASIAVSDNAVLNTSRIRVNSFKQTGGIVTVSAQDVWTETVFADIYEDGEIVGTEEVTKANYQCIEVAGEFVISGGKLILDADPAMSEHDWIAALRLENGGSVTISDNAEVVIQMSTAGNAIEVGSWPNESNPDFDPTGTFTIAGGKLNVTAAEKNNVTGIQTTPHGTVNILGGATELSNVRIRNEGTMNIGSADQTDAEITVNYDATHDQWQHTVSNAGELNVYSGTWNMSGQNMFSVFAQEGVYNQTGGTVNVTSEYDEKLNRDELGLVFAVENLKTFHLSGGELNAKGEYAIRSVPNWEDVSKQSVFTVSGGTLNADAEQVGIQLFNTDADITGGNVNINVTGAQGLGIVAGPIYGPEQQYFVTDLDITGGNHTITAKIGEGAASVALYSYLSPVDIVGNVSLVLQGTVPMQSTGNSAEDPCYITMAEGITVKGLSTYALRGPKKSEQLSLKPGSEIVNDTDENGELVTYTDYFYRLADSDGEFVSDHAELYHECEFEGEYTSDNNATCTADGTKSRACKYTYCDNKDTVTDEGTKLGHSYHNHDVTDNSCENCVYVAPTVETEGSITRSCINGCGETQTEVLNKLIAVTVTAVVDPSEIKEGETAVVTVKVEDANGEAVNGVTTDWFIEGVAGKDISALTEGTYTIVPVVEDTNYAVTVVSATLTVKKNIPTGKIEHLGSTLSLDGVIYINNYVKITGFDGIDITQNSGLLIWTTQPDESDALFGTEDIIKEHLIYVPSNGRYAQQTDGFSPKKFADEIWFRAYVKTGEDSYVYGPLKEFSVQDYCESIIKNHTTSDLKNVCIALLHYGTAAQKNFGYNEGDYSNQNIVEDYPPEAWNSELITPVTPAISNIPVSDKITHVGKTLSLDAATKINYYDKFAGESVVQERLFWIDVTGELTLDNVTEVQQMQYVQNNGRWGVQSTIFPGKLLEKTIYSCAHFVDAEGNHHYGEVIAFSPEAYANTIINTSSNQKLIEAVKRMTIYGEYAKIYFKNK